MLPPSCCQLTSFLILRGARMRMLQVQHVKVWLGAVTAGSDTGTRAGFEISGMADVVVHRRPSKNRFGWLLGTNSKGGDAPNNANGKLSKAPSRRGPGLVSGPRKMGHSASTDHLDHHSGAAFDRAKSPPLDALAGNTDTNNSAGNITPLASKKNSVISEYAFSRPPAWATKSGEWSGSAYGSGAGGYDDAAYMQQIIAQQPRFDVHEPAGPAWYINQHLRPPASARPRTSFPPSPHNPNQSSTSVGSAGGSSSAVNKVSRTRPHRGYTDTVDSLDVSDPHGTRWHHASPYELPNHRNRDTNSFMRPKSAFVGPGVGTYAGPIEGSEPVESVRQSLLNLGHLLLDAFSFVPSSLLFSRAAHCAADYFTSDWNVPIEARLLGRSLTCLCPHMGMRIIDFDVYNCSLMRT